MQTQAPRTARILAAAIFAFSCVALTLYAWLAVGGKTPLSPKGYEARVLFSNASNLTENNDVRISGVTVGKVVRVSHRALNTVATITLQPRYAPLPADAQAIIRNKTLLGETYIELSPGSKAAPKLRDGGLLPTRNVHPIQTIDQVMGTFDAPARRSFQRFLTEFAAGLRGRGEDINNALGNLAPTAADLNTVATVLDEQEAGVTQILRHGSATLRELGGRGAALRRVVTAGDQVFAATASRDRQLTGAVHVLPAFLRDLRETMAVVDRTGQAAAPTLHRLLPAAPLFAPAMKTARTLAPQLRRTMVALEPVLPHLTPGLKAVDRLVRETSPLSRALTTAGREINPMLELIAIYRDALVSGFANIGAAGQGSLPTDDGRKLHFARGVAQVTNQSLFGATTRPGSGRYNPFPAPGSMNQLATGLPSLDCRHVHNPEVVPVIGSGPPPCLQATPWTFQGKTRLYPHAEAGK